MKGRIIFSVVVVTLGLTGAMLPTKKNDSIALNEKELLKEMLLSKNYVSADELAELLISGDPSIQLIDVRPADEFKDALPRAISIPFDSLFNEDNAYVFDQSVFKNIIYGKDDKVATQVWMIMKQQGYKNNYLLKGGLKGWGETILDPKYPPQTASQAEIDLYQKRMASRLYFTGAKALPAVEFTPIIPVQGRKEKKVEGGCS